MNINVGDYVRTEYGIARYIGDLVTSETNYRTIDKNIVYENIEGWENVVTNDEIIKSSPNIIDLIEVGDYVNGIQINERIGDSVWHFSAYGDEDECFENKDIKTIVTHEQIEAMEYKIERL